MSPETLLDWAVGAATVLLLLAAALAFWRLARGPDLPDRVVALDLLAIVGVGLLGVHMLRTGSEVHVLIATVVALIAFVATIAFASYVAGRRPT
jgi:multicomponent Na+:H+ antiporter subunit F